MTEEVDLREVLDEEDIAAFRRLAEREDLEFSKYAKRVVEDL